MSVYYELLMQRDLLLINEAFDFFCKELGISDEEKKIINYKIVDSIKLKNVSGHCCSKYDFNGELFEIKIKVTNCGSVMGKIDIIAHELVHAKQNLRGELTFIEVEEPFLFFFKRKVTKRVHAKQILEDTPYYDQINEQEAFNLTYILTTKYINTIYNKSIKGDKEWFILF